MWPTLGSFFKLKLGVKTWEIREMNHGGVRVWKTENPLEGKRVYLFKGPEEGSRAVEQTRGSPGLCKLMFLIKGHLSSDSDKKVTGPVRSGCT